MIRTPRGLRPRLVRRELDGLGVLEVLREVVREGCGARPHAVAAARARVVGGRFVAGLADRLGRVALAVLGVAHARVLVHDEVHDFPDARRVEPQHGLGDRCIHACVESDR